VTRQASATAFGPVVEGRRAHGFAAKPSHPLQAAHARQADAQAATDATMNSTMKPSGSHPATAT
jgi:hypothetical protein